MAVVGEVADGELTKLIVSLYSPRVKPGAQQPSLGDFLMVEAKGFQVVGVVSHIRFKPRELPQPLGLEPERVKAMMPDIEDVVYSQVLKLASMPLIGYVRDGVAYHATPPLLPDIHDVASTLGDDAVEAFHSADGGWRLDYLPRLLREDVELRVEVLATVFRRLHTLLRLEEGEFLKRLSRAHEEAWATPLPTSLAVTLTRLMR